MRVRILYLILILLVFSCPLFDQEKEIKEGVVVTNIEIPVRVFLKGETVDNLKKEEFTLLINGKERDIAGFSITRKRLEEQEIVLAESGSELPSRYFIMAMNITNFSPEIKDGVSYILNKVLRDKDVLLVFINNTTKVYNDLKDKSAVREELFSYIDGESIKAHTRMQLYFKEIERTSNYAKFKMMMKKGGGRLTPEKEVYFISDFLKNYLNIWNEYKNRYLTPDVNTYYNLSRYLQNIRIEKWVISFFQVEMFPEIALDGEIARIIRSKVYDWQASEDIEEVTFSRIISRQLSEVQQAMNVSNGFPTEEVTKIFTKVGATFHSVFIPSVIPTFSNDMTYKQISSDLENNLRSLTEKTGGELVSSADLEKAMDRIVKKQDVFYVLTYAPDEGETLENVKIKVRNKKYDLAYDDNTRLAFSSKESAPASMSQAPDVIIGDLKFSKKKLSFSMTGFVINKKNGNGIINVRIRINDHSGKSLFDKNKTLNTIKKTANLSLNFPWLNPGDYEIIVDVQDLNTKNTGTDILKVKVK